MGLDTIAQLLVCHIFNVGIFPCCARAAHVLRLTLHSCGNIVCRLGCPFPNWLIRCRSVCTAPGYGVYLNSVVYGYTFFSFSVTGLFRSLLPIVRGQLVVREL